MTIQPNDRKQELTPEFQDEAQHGKSGDRKPDRTPGKADPRRASAPVNGDVAANKDEALNKDTAWNKDKDGALSKDAALNDKDAVANKDTVQEQRADAQRTESQRADAKQADAKRTESKRADADTDVVTAGNEDRAKDKAGSTARHATDDKKPGSLQNQAPAEARTRLFQDQDVTKYREQWRELQSGFVDEPRGAVREADTLVSQMLDSLTSQLTEQKRALQGESDAEDTERLRVALQRYRSLFDQMLQV